MDLTRPQSPNPYEFLPRVPAFQLWSEDLADGADMPERHTASGGGTSPHLAWSGFPDGTRGFAVTCFDPDAPTPAGWWHWMIVDLDVATTALPRGAGLSDLMLEGTAFHLANDDGDHSYGGAAPPPGDRAHRYMFVVHALDVELLNIDEYTTPTAASLELLPATLARAHLTVTCRR